MLILMEMVNLMVKNLVILTVCGLKVSLSNSCSMSELLLTCRSIVNQPKITVEKTLKKNVIKSHF